MGFPGKEVFLGNMESALALFLAPSKHDAKVDRAFKRFVKENWCRWEKCVSVAPPKYRGLIGYLASRGNRRAFTGAFEHVDRRFVLLALCGYQSYLWNRIASSAIGAACEAGRLRKVTLPFKYGDLVFYLGLDDRTAGELSRARIDVPGYDSVFDDPNIASIAGCVLAGEGISLSDLKVRKLYHTRVRSVRRDLLAVPSRFEVLGTGPDDLYPGRKKVRIGFFLGRGSYATMIVKRLFIDIPPEVPR
jgi:tRNA pseudouridine13 synthase